MTKKKPRSNCIVCGREIIVEVEVSMPTFPCGKCAKQVEPKRTLDGPAEHKGLVMRQRVGQGRISS
jgi:hypothetical protein